MNETKIGFTILAIIGLMAVMGFVSMMNGQSTGLYYGGAIKQVYYPYSEDRLVKAGSQDGIYPVESTEAYARTQRAIFNSRATERIYTTLTSCRGQVAEGNIPEGYTYEYSFTELIDRGLDWKTDCINVYELIGGGGWCCKATGTHSRF